jgi:hypothetical protein
MCINHVLTATNINGDSFRYNTMPILAIVGIHNFRDWCCHLYSSCSSATQRWLMILTYLGSHCIKFHPAR